MPDFSPVLRLIGPLGDAEVTDGRNSRGWWVIAAFRDAAGKRRLLVHAVFTTAAKAVKARRRAERAARRAVGGEVPGVR